MALPHLTLENGWDKTLHYLSQDEVEIEHGWMDEGSSLFCSAFVLLFERSYNICFNATNIQDEASLSLLLKDHRYCSSQSEVLTVLISQQLRQT